MSRPIQTLKLYSSGLQTKQIACQLGISIDTVNKHLRAARKQLNAKTTAEAVYKAVKIGLICWAGFFGGTTDDIRRPPTSRAGLSRTIQQAPLRQI